MRRGGLSAFYPGGKAEPKKGKGWRDAETIAALYSLIKSELIKLLSVKPRTFSEIQAKTDYYETDLRACLKLVGATYGYMRGATRKQYYLGD